MQLLIYLLLSSVDISFANKWHPDQAITKPWLIWIQTVCHSKCIFEKLKSADDKKTRKRVENCLQKLSAEHA